MQPFSALILLSVVINCGCYFLISRKLKSAFNVTTLYFASMLFFDHFLGYANLALFGNVPSTYALGITYGTYALSGIAIFLATCIFHPPELGWLHLRPQKLYLRTLPLAILVLSALIYLPVLITYRQYISEPRLIYTSTRTGWGPIFFVSILLCDIAFVLFLFKAKKSIFTQIIFWVSCPLLLYLHGTKGSILSLALVYVLFRVNVQNKPFGFTKAFGVGLVLITVFIAIFAVFRRADNDTSLLLSIAGYSDYDRNGMNVIDHPMPGYPFLGRIALEQEFYTRIPRAVMPNKPKNFGPFLLAEYYFPSWFESDTGSPAFGIGARYADFGPFTLIIEPLLNGIIFAFASGIARVNQKLKRIDLFIVMLFFSGITLLPVGTGFLLPETLCFAWLVQRCAALRIYFVAPPSSVLRDA